MLIDDELREFNGSETSAGGSVGLRCPYCRREGTMARLGKSYSNGRPAGSSEFRGVGFYRCAFGLCRSLIVIACDRGGHAIWSWPAEPVDWDDTALPTDVRNAMQEAVDCHSVGAYRAAGAMIRLVLEEIARDLLDKEEYDSLGSLHNRLAAMGGGGRFPDGYVDGLTDLKLLGNDSVHPVPRDFDPTKANVELALAVVRQVVALLYQQQELLNALRDAKRAAQPE